MTGINGKYHNIVIDEKLNTFHIEETTKKGNIHALSTLEKIKQIRDKKMEYVVPEGSKDALDPKKFEEGVLEPLQEIAKDVCSEYKKKINGFGWFKKYFFGNKLKKNVDILFKSIFSPTHLFSFTIKTKEGTQEVPAFIPALAIHKIFDFLPLSDIGKLAQNREGASRVDKEIAMRARTEFGYVGTDDKEAKKYMEQLFTEVKSMDGPFTFPHSPVLTRDNFSLEENTYSDPTIKVEESLQKLKSLTPTELMRLFRDRSPIHGAKFTTVKKFFYQRSLFKSTIRT